VISDFKLTKNDVEFLKTSQVQNDMNFKSLEFFMNQVQPIREFTQQTNLLHNILRGKEDYNNLIEVEHNFYKKLK
jgi:hypothetical protein